MASGYRPQARTLRRLRDDKGMSLGEIARMYGVSRSTVHRWLRGDGAALETTADVPTCEAVER